MSIRNNPLLALFLLFIVNIISASAFGLPLSSSQGLTLKGEATYRYWGFRVYTARLYAQSDISDIQAKLGATPMRLSLTYARSLASDDFVKSGEAFMKDNPDINFESLKSTLDKMNALYQDVNEGDTYTIDFEPGKGISLYLNDDYKGSVTGDQFAKGYLGIWLSKYSLSQSFTNLLIGNT